VRHFSPFNSDSINNNSFAELLRNTKPAESAEGSSQPGCVGKPEPIMLSLLVFDFFFSWSKNTGPGIRQPSLLNLTFTPPRLS
jgi:hypothetical protein